MTVSLTARLRESRADFPVKTMEHAAQKLAGRHSHWREFCHFADALSPSLLIHLLNVEGGAAE